MDWIQILTLAGVNVTLIAALTTLVVWAINKLDADVKSLCVRMDKMDARFESHSARIDQLYKMFVDLLKNQQ